MVQLKNGIKSQLYELFFGAFINSAASGYNDSVSPVQNLAVTRDMLFDRYVTWFCSGHLSCPPSDGSN